MTTEDNLQTLCWKCNRTKSSKIDELKNKEISITCKLLIKKSSTTKCRINEPSVHENYQNLQYQGHAEVGKSTKTVVVNNN